MSTEETLTRALHAALAEGRTARGIARIIRTVVADYDSLRGSARTVLDHCADKLDVLSATEEVDRAYTNLGKLTVDMYLRDPDFHGRLWPIPMVAAARTILGSSAPTLPDMTCEDAS